VRPLLLWLSLLAALPARAVPLPPAQAARVTGDAFLIEGGARRRLAPGAALGEGARIATAAQPDLRLELSFGAHGLVRVGPDSEVQLALAERRLLLLRGQVLVSADRMVGGIAVMWPGGAATPLGTTYLLSIEKDGARVTVLEGQVELQRPGAREVLIVCPGETGRVPEKGPLARAQGPIDRALQAEPLLAGHAPLPALQLARITALIDEQRRGILAGRNDRLRRELRWRRPARKTLVLPELLRVPQ
jgi:ferric-dicitrate binding protein FerR (iron transport regulator)